MEVYWRRDPSKIFGLVHMIITVENVRRFHMEHLMLNPGNWFRKSSRSFLEFEEYSMHLAKSTGTLMRAWREMQTERASANAW